MKKTIVISLILAFAATAFAAGSKPVTPAVSKEIKHYNKGVELMLDKKFSKAEKQFRKALEAKDAFAEAHNNLAYTLRKQGSDYYEEALVHYNRAITINPNLAEP